METFAPIYYAAYHLGAWVTGEKAHALRLSATQDAELWERLSNVGLPLFVGLGITASLAGLASYALIAFGWYWRVKLKRRRSATAANSP
ncbi:MAG: DUF2062 domain-containing protein [Rhodocyclaceae bacterium]|nr:DUF2062 domain-containing protein [Rhodocyclaceae bacterium]